MSKKYKKVCRTLNYFWNFLDVVSAVSGVVSIYIFASLFAVPVGMTSSSIGLKICAISTNHQEKEKKNKYNQSYVL